eukprot:5708780-Pleurochrysis_carterae.AAC.3
MERYDASEIAKRPEVPKDAFKIKTSTGRVTGSKYCDVKAGKIISCMAKEALLATCQVLAPGCGFRVSVGLGALRLNAARPHGRKLYSQQWAGASRSLPTAPLARD